MDLSSAAEGAGISAEVLGWALVPVFVLIYLTAWGATIYNSRRPWPQCLTSVAVSILLLYLLLFAGSPPIASLRPMTGSSLFFFGTHLLLTCLAIRNVRARRRQVRTD